MKSRRELNDRDGYRTVYVVERNEGMFGKDLWIPMRIGNGFWYKLNATKLMKREYKRCKTINSDWRKKDFRVALYVRAD